MPKVWNKRNPDVPANAVYVGRPTKYGNPFKISKRQGRIDCVRCFRQSITPGFAEMVRKELRGKDLVCWCAPEACHADILLEIANDEKETPTN